MDVLDLLAEAKKDGVQIEAIDGELIITAKPSQKFWVQRLLPYKQEIIAHLTGEPTAEEIDELPKQVDRYKPFPIHALPVHVGSYVSAASKAIGCDPSFVALPLLASLARAIGNSRVIRLKRTWSEPAIIWAGIVGKSGTHKTPAMRAAMRFLESRQAESIAKSIEELANHEQDQAQYERDFAAWKKSKTVEPPPWKPAEPVCTRYITSDCTIEALAALLAVQFDGLLVSRDELAGWLGGIAEYKGGKGSDLGHWLACWSAQSLTVDRKTGATKMIHVPYAAVSLVGGIQPGVLRQAIGREHLQDGLCARLLLAMPESKPVRWTDDTVDVNTEQAMGEVFDRLIGLEPAANENGEPEPFPLDMTLEAKAAWIEYYNRHRAELADLGDDLAAAWSKLEAYTARFALIFQLCDCPHDNAIDEAAMTAAIELSDWFGVEAKRVYGLFVETAEDRERRKLVELIRRKGGRLTARELQQGCRLFKKSVDAETALDGLVGSGWGKWEVVPTATKQRREFVLSAASTYTDSPISADSRKNVYVDGLDDPQTPLNGEAVHVADGDNDWGLL